MHVVPAILLRRLVLIAIAVLIVIVIVIIGPAALAPQAGALEPGGSPTVAATPSPTPPPPVIRLDDGVLRWLPEILDASEQTDVVPEMIAALMHIESHGNPNIISPAGARGLMQIMPEEMGRLGVPQESWHDPATNILAGARALRDRAVWHGSWDGAISAYFGFGCDVFGTCTQTYLRVAHRWMAIYAPIIADPLNSGIPLLPADWVPPAINPFVEKAPATPTPEPTPTDTPTATATATATEPAATEPVETPTATASVETAIPATEPPAPTAVPTEPPAPTEIPQPDPTELPSETEPDSGSEATPKG